MAEALPPQPAWAPLWTGPLEAGDTHFFVSRGYVHVIGMPARRRQVGRRRLARMGQLRPDRMDRQRSPGATAMSAWSASRASAPSSFTSPSSSPRISRRSSRSIRAAPMACSAASARNIRAACCTCSAIWSATSPPCTSTGARPASCPAERETLWREAMANPDYRMYPNIYNLLAQKGQHMPPYFDLLIDPYDKEEVGPRRAKPSSPRSRCRPTPAPAGTATRTRPTSTARRAISPTSTRRRS